MPEIYCPNPKCRAAMQVPVAALGKRGTCKKCQTPFVAQATPAPAAGITPVPPPLPGPPLQSPPPLTPAAKGVPTVVARRSTPAKPRRPVHVGWLIGALAALLVPILAASALTFFKPTWRKKPGLTYAGIEIGSHGPRFSIVEFFPEAKGEATFRFLGNQQTAARLTDGMEKTGKINPQALSKTVLSVKKFYDQLQKDHGIAPERIVIVSSLGLFGPIASRGDLDKKEKDRLIAQGRKTLSAAIKEATGQAMEFADRTLVAEHQIKAVVRQGDTHDAVFLDVGGGGTRGGYADAAGQIHALEGPGSKKFMAAVNDGLEDSLFADRAATLVEAHLREPFRNGLGKDPEFTVRGKVYVAGGITWVMANCQHPEEAEDYVRVSADDIATFADRVRKNPDLLSQIRVPESLPADRQDWLRREYSKMRGAFKTREDLIAGADVLLALSTELKFTGREVWFYRHSDFAWLVSYIKETRYARK